MSVQAICIDDTTNAGQVVAALQRAVDAVLDPATVSYLEQRGCGMSAWRRIHPRNGADGPPAAMVQLASSITNGPDWTLSIYIYHGYSQESLARISPDVVRRLRLGLEGIVCGIGFDDDVENQKFVSLMSLPRSVFWRLPRGVVSLA